MVLSVNAFAAPKKMKLNYRKVTLRVGEKKKLKVKNNKRHKKVKWRSTNKKIAKINKKGVITAKRTGICRIIAKVNGRTLTCKVTVVSRKQSGHTGSGNPSVSSGTVSAGSGSGSPGSSSSVTPT